MFKCMCPPTKKYFFGSVDGRVRQERIDAHLEKNQLRHAWQRSCFLGKEHMCAVYIIYACVQAVLAGRV